MCGVLVSLFERHGIDKSFCGSAELSSLRLSAKFADRLVGLLRFESVNFICPFEQTLGVRPSIYFTLTVLFKNIS